MLPGAFGTNSRAMGKESRGNDASVIYDEELIAP